MIANRVKKFMGPKSTLPYYANDVSVSNAYFKFNSNIKISYFALHLERSIVRATEASIIIVWSD